MRKLLKTLETFRGRHTELISLYIPSGHNIQEIMNMLKQEYALTQNVKSRTTRHNVLNALEKTMNHLRLFKKTPPNGLVIFCGNVSKTEGQPEIKLWSVEPPQPLAQKIYWCDQNFVLDPLKDMIREREVYGLIVIDTSGSDIGLLKGKKVILEKHIDSLVPGKTSKGGWSQQRYQRIREEAKNEHLKKTGEVASKIFSEEKDLKGVIIGGPGPLKERFKEGEYLDYRLQNKVLGVVDTSYTSIQGLQEIIQRGESLIQEASATKERHIMEEFFEHLKKDDGLSVYGLEEVEHALDYGAVKTLLISEGFNWTRAKLTCSCGYSVEKDVNLDRVEKCPKCGKEMTIEEEKDLIEMLSERAKSLGSEVEIISIDSREGEQFKEIGGIGAILRYKIV
ncbi:MAG: peptide chain release factor aRF-1 [Candidatus Aenigmarchaeota archaeon]|nr:peptide chain release factor aRF-1 [Candidatus Aenigmarchaeota archaeon]